MPASPSPLPLPVRRGVTLLELLVVLVLMGVAGAVVAPLLTRPAGLPADPASRSAALVVDARRAAIRRGEPVRLRVAADGVWALVSLRDGTVISGGRIDTGPAARDRDAVGAVTTAVRLDLRIDAMGSCTPAGTTDLELGQSGAALDPLACTAVDGPP